MLGLMLKVILWHAVLLIAIAVYPWKIDFDPQPIDASVQPPALDDDNAITKLKPNNALEFVEFLHKGAFVGPESLSIHGETIYTGVYGGYILAIGGTGIHKITRLGSVGAGNCKGLFDQETCGRVLGLRTNFDGTKLLVADAYYGIYMVDTETGEEHAIIARGAPVDGRPLELMNDVVADARGVIYFSESSNKWPLSKIVWSILEGETSGRVLAYDPKRRRMNVLMSNLACPNGVELTHDGKALLVAETGKARIVRYYLEGELKGRQDVFASNLPGEPDNIRKSTSGGYWVGFVNGRVSRSHGFVTATLRNAFMSSPKLRLALVRVMHAVGSSVGLLADWWPTSADVTDNQADKAIDSDAVVSQQKLAGNTRLRELAAYFSNGWFLYDQLPRYGLVIELDAVGAVQRALHAPSGRVNFISEVLEHDGYLYLGSFRNDFIGRIKLD